MKCVICKMGEMKVGRATVTLERNGAVVVIKGVPALVCDNCGENAFEEPVNRRLLELAEKAYQAGIEVAIRDYSDALVPR